MATRAVAFTPLAAVATVVASVLSVPSSSYGQTAESRRPQAPSAKQAVEAHHPPAAAENLLPNGNFETPARDGTHPAHWQQVDNLVFFWTTDPKARKRGKVIKIDTDV